MKPKDIKILLVIVTAFLLAYFIPVDSPRFQGAVIESFAMVHDYAREHILLCLVPAFLIAGAISVFLKQDAVIKYLGSDSNKLLAYGIAATSGTILAVCSCTVLPLFAGIYTQGAGIGPAAAFLYSGPAINILAIILTAHVLGASLGISRALGAISFSIIIGLIMAVIFRKDDKKRLSSEESNALEKETITTKPLWQTGLYFASMISFLVFANWGKPLDMNSYWGLIYSVKWVLAGLSLAGLFLILVFWFTMSEIKVWIRTSWEFAQLILPLLLGGVLVAGFLLGRPGHEGIIPSQWIANLVGGNSLAANLFASISGALMYFATLTEVPILQGLIGSGMGKGPALTLLLSGPALSLPSMLVIRQIMGTKKTLVYISLVVILSALMGWIYGMTA
jgi:uncharacterized membrane protein YraQ (UPF0718 family)